MSQNKIRIVFDQEESVRLDKYVAELRIQELYSRTFVERLIEEDRILVNLIPVKKSYMLESGDEIDINLPEPEPIEIVPRNIPLDVIWEDKDIAVINKPAGLIVHPGFGNPDNTLVNALMWRWGSELSSGRGANRPGIVHRLDSGTSGLMIVAKNDPVQSKLCEMFAERQVRKTYLGISCGVPDPLEGSIDGRIGRSRTNPRKMCVSDDGRWSLTEYKTICCYHCFAMVKIHLETGRMHQIRVHFAHRNMPLLGDLLYNTRRYVHALVPENMKRKVTELLTTHLLRQALHAWRLEFAHPTTGEWIDLTAPVPNDILYTLSWLEKYFAPEGQNCDLNELLEKNLEW
jgi:23S rRNA pseudouridine1911/1915/1917 synthase